MRETDIAIVGAGLAGSLAAVMLGRAGHSVTLIDPFQRARPDFRCEKLEEAHVEMLRRAGVLDEVLPIGRRYRDIWVARLGRLAEVKDIEEYGIEYGELVNRLRDLVPENVSFVASKVTHAATSEQRQILTLLNGDSVSARLVVGASGVMPRLPGERRQISACHSVSVGFDIEAGGWPFEALTYFGEDPVHRVAYLTLFPLPGGWRANLFVYRELNDPWFRSLRNNPGAAIAASLPGLFGFTGLLRPRGPLKVRPVDLVATEGVVQAGVALVGDAFSTACPVSGIGAAKAMLDVEQLCNVYIPQWLATPGMPAEKIAQFYSDAEKKRSDAHSLQTSTFAKRAALGQGLLWTAFRWGYYAGSQTRNFLERGELAEIPRRDTVTMPIRDAVKA